MYCSSPLAFSLPPPQSLSLPYQYSSLLRNRSSIWSHNRRSSSLIYSVYCLTRFSCFFYRDRLAGCNSRVSSASWIGRMSPISRIAVVVSFDLAKSPESRSQFRLVNGTVSYTVTDYSITSAEEMYSIDLESSLSSGAFRISEFSSAGLIAEFKAQLKASI